MIGTVNWFASKGQSYGFIRYDEAGSSLQVYVHYKSIGTKNLRPESWRGGKWFKELKKGDVVSFSLAEGFGVTGSQAINVEIVEYVQ